LGARRRAGPTSSRDRESRLNVWRVNRKGGPFSSERMVELEIPTSTSTRGGEAISKGMPFMDKEKPGNPKAKETEAQGKFGNISSGKQVKTADARGPRGEGPKTKNGAFVSKGKWGEEGREVRVALTSSVQPSLVTWQARRFPRGNLKKRNPVASRLSKRSGGKSKTSLKKRKGCDNLARARRGE